MGRLESLIPRFWKLRSSASNTTHPDSPSKLLRLNTRASKSGFFDLPLDLLLQIVEYLPAENIYYLALTNKSLYHNAMIRRLWINDPKLNIWNIKMARNLDSGTWFKCDCGSLHPTFINPGELPCFNEQWSTYVAKKAPWSYVKSNTRCIGDKREIMSLRRKPVSTRHMKGLRNKSTEARKTYIRRARAAKAATDEAQIQASEAWKLVNQTDLFERYIPTTKAMAAQAEYRRLRAISMTYFVVRLTHEEMASTWSWYVGQTGQQLGHLSESSGFM